MKYNIKIHNSEIVTIDTGDNEINYIEIEELEKLAKEYKHKCVRIVLNNGKSKVIHYVGENKIQNNKIIIERVDDEI